MSYKEQFQSTCVYGVLGAKFWSSQTKPNNLQDKTIYMLERFGLSRKSLDGQFQESFEGD